MTIFIGYCIASVIVGLFVARCMRVGSGGSDDA